MFEPKTEKISKLSQKYPDRILEEAEKCGYIVKTKPVKVMQLSIDVSSIPPNSPEILKNFIRTPLFKKLKVETIEFLNNQLKELNRQGILFAGKEKFYQNKRKGDSLRSLQALEILVISNQ